MAASAMRKAPPTPKSAIKTAPVQKAVPTRKNASVRKKIVAKKRGLMFAEISIGLVILAFIAGGIIVGHQLMSISQVHTQITQIMRYDEAVMSFHEKFNGLPGDILAASAEREGLPSGNGTPAHSDGDGKISPCNTGWQWHLGCETALFWAQLSATGYIEENFNADSRLEDKRLQEVGMMDPYLPKSELGDNIYMAVWSTSDDEQSPEPRLPYGNYFEITKIIGVANGKFEDDGKALTPAQASAIDDKVDDGYPLSGRMIVNGTTNWPNDAWGTFATPSEENCVSANRRYNTLDAGHANTLLCHIAIALNCCDSRE